MQYQGRGDHECAFRERNDSSKNTVSGPHSTGHQDYGLQTSDKAVNSNSNISLFWEKGDVGRKKSKKVCSNKKATTRAIANVNFSQ